MSSSGNQRSTIKLFVDGVEDKSIPLVYVNFSLPTVRSFQDHVMALVRLHPWEPLYECESIRISDIEVNETLLKNILSEITKDILSGKKTPKIKIIVNGRRPAELPPKVDNLLCKKAAVPIYKKKVPVKIVEVLDERSDTESLNCSLIPFGDDASRNQVDLPENIDSNDETLIKVAPKSSEISLASVDASTISPIRRKILELSDSRNSVWRVRDGATGESNNRDARPQSVRVPSTRISKLQTNTVASILKRKSLIFETMEQAMSFTWVDAGSDNTHASSNGSVGAGDKSTGGDENANASATRQKRAPRPPSMKLHSTTPVKRNIPEKSSSSIISEPVEKEELYKGGQTAAEITNDFNQSLRSPILITKTNISRPLSLPKKASHYAGNRSSVRRGSFKKGSGGLSGYAGNRGSVRTDRVNGGDFPDMGDRRPSMGTITSQWEFMRSNFVNNSEEELEWLMISKRSGAYKHAHKKSDAAEDKYFKALYEIDFYENQIKYLTHVASVINPILVNMFEESSVLTVNPESKQSLENVRLQQLLLVSFLDEDKGKCEKEKDNIVKSELKASIKKSLYAISSNLQRHAAAKEANNMVKKEIINKEIKEAKMLFSGANKSSDEALKGMEKWSKREKETLDYHEVMLEEEIIWLEKESDANNTALSLMRSYIPLLITEMNIDDIKESVKERNGLFTLELLNEIKSNKLLQWVVMHPNDISMENFLMGEKKQYFENFEKLDVIELRALISVIPRKFELDGDGKKADWRDRFMGRAKQIISQEIGDSVKGVWDPTIGSRSMIKLKSLKSELKRRPVYYYPTIEQCQEKLKQLDSRQALLKKKEDWLAKATATALSCKEEYDTLLADMRDPEIKAYFGADKISAAKETAKREWQDAESNRKTLQEDVTRLERTIADAPITRIQFAESMEEIRQHLLGKGYSWDGKEIEIKIASESEISLTSEGAVEGEPIAATVTDIKSLMPIISTAATSTLKNLLFLVDGVFDANPIVERVTRQAAKFVTAEEEAECRKLEISALKNRNTAGVIDKNEEEQSTDIEDIISITDTISGLNSASSGTISDAPGILVGSEKMKINNEDDTSISTFYGNGDTVTGNNLYLNRLRITAPNISERDSQMITYCNSPMIRGNSNRNPVLSSVNPDLINCLNKMFAPQNGKNSGSSSARDLPFPNSPRTSVTDEGSNRTLNIDTSDIGMKFEPSSPSRSGPGSARLDFFHKSGSGSTIGSSKPNSPMHPLVFKGCKSKLLQNLQAQREKAEQAPTSPKEIIAEEDSGMESLRPPRPAMPMSFLDELKAKKNKSSTGVTPPALNLSFLDQIKAKKQQNNDDNAGNLQITEHNTVDVLPITLPTPPDLSSNQPSFLDEIKAKKNKMMPPMGGMSFLEQIKARKQALD